MKVVNMTQLARQSKSVIEDAINSKALVVTPGSKDNVVMVSEDHYNAITKINSQLASVIDKVRAGMSLMDAQEEVIKVK